MPLAPGWAGRVSHLPAGPTVVEAEVSPPAGAPRTGWAGSFRLAGVDDPVRVVKETWAAARRGELAGALVAVTWR